MFNKLLIASVLFTIAIVTYGTTAVIATSQADPQQAGSQDVRPVPQVPTAESAGGEQPGQQVTEEFHQTYPLSATGRVNLGNINGGVKIKVWDRAAVQVDAIKKAYRRERLTEAQIEVTSTEENIRIKTEYPDQDQNFRSGEGRYNNPAIVEYSLTVPRKAMLESIELINGPLDIDGVEGNVKASSINGPVTARGLMGEARLTTVNGQLQATFTQLDETKPISLGSVNGSVTVVIPSDSNASFRASTVHGSIRNDFGIQVKHGEYVGHNLDAQIGNGGPRLKLTNVNGAINITRAQDGRPLSPVTSIARVDLTRDEMMAEDVVRENEMTTAELTLKKMETARIVRETRQAQREAARQVDAEVRKAQREIDQAQREVQRQQREIRVRVPRVIINQNNGDWNKFSNQETKSFAVSGSPRVSITTFDGPVTVRGWDQSEVKYTATKRASDEESLKQISIKTEQQGQTIAINAINENAENGSVHLEVFVPRNSSLHVTSGDGPLTLDGVSGDITLRSGDGPITVVNGGGQLHVNTGDGPILINKFDGQVDARTGDGPIALDGNFNALSARTGDGEISLTVPAGSSFTIETNAAADGISNEGFNVAEDVTLSPRVKRWKVGNGGRVFVLRTGEGKVLLRPRN
ncbi:MAG TPA: DUF4097 family beta strand repeat-containing protein [Pyrinomonadaceae bacterium]|nr:DUF4097 family beta strand repeat-containing protein [Pyrinomonadaceae bacterium]